jgi:hypothetical protein
MRPASTTLVTVAALALGCGDETSPETPPAAPSETPPAPAVPSPVAAEEASDPCALLTVGMIRDALEVPAAAEITSRLTPRPRPLCSYVWPKPNAEELREQAREAQQRHAREIVKRMRAGEGVQGVLNAGLDLPATDNRVSLTFANEADTPELALHWLADGNRRLNEGVSTQVKVRQREETVTLQASSVAVDGVGDGAFWSARMHDLSFVHETRLFSVHAEVGDGEGAADADLAAAKTLAAVVIDAL